MHFSKPTDPDPKMLSGEFLFRQEKVWEQLEEKIIRPRKKKGYVWLAAACIAAIATLSMWKITPGEKAVVKPSINSLPQKENHIVTDQPAAEPLKTRPVENITRANPKSSHNKIASQSITRNEPKLIVITEPEIIKPPVEIVVTEPSKQPTPRRFRISHINDVNPTNYPSIAGRTKKETSVSYTEPTIAEINDIQTPIKPKGMFGLLRTNQ